jgi:mono/diheme cytochrome c family protein
MKRLVPAAVFVLILPVAWSAPFRSVVVADNLAAAPSASPATDDGPGAQLYKQTCAVCHMTDGKGVPGMQPPLITSKFLGGDSRTLIRLLIVGPAQALPANRTPYSSQMPTFEALSDAEIADVLSYTRRTFAKKPAPITPAQVAALRPKH